MEELISAAKPTNPFNPGSPVDPNDFVGRQQYLTEFEQKLRQTAGGSLANMAVTGGYGIGKTSFLHKCNAIAENMGALTVYFSLNEVDKEIDATMLSNILLQRLNEKIRGEVLLKRLSADILNTIKRMKVAAAGVEISYNDSITEIAPNLQSALTKIWKSLKDKKLAIVFLIDEAGILEHKRADLVLYLRAVIENLQIEHTPVMIVPAGKISIYGPSGSGFSPLVRTFTPILLENFSRADADAFISNKLKSVGIKIPDSILIKVYESTEGHPFVLSAYMQSVYSKMQINEREVTEAHLNAVDLDFSGYVLAPFFARFYDQAGRMSRNIMLEMAKKGGEGVLSDLSETLHRENYEISPHLAKLVQDGAIIRTERGHYRLFHHLLGQYILNFGKK